MLLLDFEGSNSIIIVAATSSSVVDSRLLEDSTEDAPVLFLFTSNRSKHLEAALASRPVRVDQAIEFPLPDAGGRREVQSCRSASL